MCVETYSNFKVFGRVIVREKMSTLGVGMIKEIKWIPYCIFLITEIVRIYYKNLNILKQSKNIIINHIITH